MASAHSRRWTNSSARPDFLHASSSTSGSTVRSIDSTDVVTVQAIAAAVSAVSAAGLAWLTVRRDRDARQERERDLEREQLRAILNGLGRVRAVIMDRDAFEPEFDLARAELATALALRPIDLYATERLLADDVPKPPYAVGQSVPWDRLDAALEEFLEYVRTAQVD
jgi:hypothetical protein